MHSSDAQPGLVLWLATWAYAARAAAGTPCSNGYSYRPAPPLPQHSCALFSLPSIAAFRLSCSWRRGARQRMFVLSPVPLCPRSCGPWLLCLPRRVAVKACNRVLLAPARALLPRCANSQCTRCFFTTKVRQPQACCIQILGFVRASAARVFAFAHRLSGAVKCVAPQPHRGRVELVHTASIRSCVSCSMRSCPIPLKAVAMRVPPWRGRCAILSLAAKHTAQCMGHGAGALSLVVVVDAETNAMRGVLVGAPPGRTTCSVPRIRAPARVE